MLDSEPEVEAPPVAGALGAADGADENELVERFISEFDAEVLIDDQPARSGPDGSDLPDETEERLEETS